MIQSALSSLGMSQAVQTVHTQWSLETDFPRLLLVSILGELCRIQGVGALALPGVHFYEAPITSVGPVVP